MALPTIESVREVKAELDRDGFAIVEDFASASVIEDLKAAISGLGDRAGARQLHQTVPAVREFLQSELLLEWMELLAAGAFPVRTMFFDKTPTANWKVAWHQDLTICVQERHQVPGFGAWSVKEGVVHTQPPVEVLERMVTVRLHLDDCGMENGPLRVIPGSHRSGRLSVEQIKSWRQQREPLDCLVRRGGLVLMKPLILHSSSGAIKPAHRRVLHIEFATEPLPAPLKWTA